MALLVGVSWAGTAGVARVAGGQGCHAGHALGAQTHHRWCRSQFAAGAGAAHRVLALVRFFWFWRSIFRRAARRVVQPRHWTRPAPYWIAGVRALPPAATQLALKPSDRRNQPRYRARHQRHQLSDALYDVQYSADAL